MEHTIAISSTLIPLLLSLLGGNVLLTAWLLKKLMDRNQTEHDKAFDLILKHDSTLIEHGVRLDKVEVEVDHLRGSH